MLELHASPNSVDDSVGVGGIGGVGVVGGGGYESLTLTSSVRRRKAAQTPLNEQGYDARIAQNHAQDDDQGSHPHHAVVIRVANDFP
eukprot:CAMPEP_0181217944 /NCGR_PEP_ID=MMETSP1096-20121128/27423_1 /TAXON_ID=156174 ORGANISM="Chrysochromulina ericina, Strain CCMP281" /NCGR_SAMPLE_ID=MMETSP1096 /ASSEMBLY_ACC=CAM_ASM_000453 /LENGTH=86 /DNA_ID=CAMNT_0023310113 /DNA_START=631 /DNA_END=892 /DNA_ORIENTATION=-